MFGKNSRMQNHNKPNNDSVKKNDNFLSRQPIFYSNVKVKVNGNEIYFSRRTKHLSKSLNSSVSFKGHVCFFSRKISKSAGSLY